MMDYQPMDHQISYLRHKELETTGLNIKVAIYCRLSDEDRNKANPLDESESIQNQKNMLTRYAMEQGWSIFKIYSDDDFSGQDRDRPEFNEMIRDAEEGKFQIILCKTQARFSRDMETVEKYLHREFPIWGIRFVGLVDHADTANKSNKKQRQITGLTNDWYSEETSDNIRASFLTKYKEGKFIGSFATYGYLKDPTDKNKLIIDEEAANIVKMIYNLYMEGYGAQHITYQLNDMQIPNPTKHKENLGLNFINSSKKDNRGLWNKTTVKRILTNELYLGHMIQNKRTKISYKSKKYTDNPRDKWVIVKNTHEPIIDARIFEEVQKRMAANRRSTGTGKAHVFATKVKCKDCGSNMNKVTLSRTNNKYSYLRCKLYSITPGTEHCTGHFINLVKLKDIVTEKIKERIDDYLDEDNVASRLLAEMDYSKKISSIKKDLTKVDSQLALNSDVLRNLYLDKVKGLISESEFIDLKGNFEQAKNSLTKQKENLETLLSNTEEQKNNIKDIIKTVKQYKNFEELDSVIVGHFIDYIEIGEKNKETDEQDIIIHWLLW